LAGEAGISGSVTIGDFVMMGGASGTADNVSIGEGAQIGAWSGVMNDIPAGGKWLGIPARPARAFFREIAVLKRLVEESRVAQKGEQPHDGPGTDDPT
jgi:UDP-3-O-[3-hydroxymyristoyl] glucosamine N-acyltransferase